MTRRHVALLRAIAAYWSLHHFAPTIRDLMVETETTATSTVVGRLRFLRRAGLVVWDAGTARTIRLTVEGAVLASKEASSVA